MVTRQIGKRDSFRVNSAALVLFLSEVRRERPFQNDLENILNLVPLHKHNRSLSMVAGCHFGRSGSDAHSDLCIESVSRDDQAGGGERRR